MNPNANYFYRLIYLAQSKIAARCFRARSFFRDVVPAGVYSFLGNMHPTREHKFRRIHMVSAQAQTFRRNHLCSRTFLPPHLLYVLAASACLFGTAVSAENSALNSEPPEVQSTVLNAISLMKDHHPDSAAMMLQSKLPQFPQSLALHFELGNAYSESRQFQEAIREYESVLHAHPEFTEAELNIAYAYCNMNQNSDAVFWFERYLRENPHSPKFSQVQGQMLVAGASESLAHNRAYDARKLLERAIQIDPQDVHAHFKLARAFDDLGDTQDAIKEYETVLTLQPSHSASVFNIAGCYQTLGKPQESIMWFKRYLKNNPDAPDKDTVLNMISKLKETEHLPAEDPRGPDFYEAVTDKGECIRWPRERLPLKVYVSNGDGVQGFRESFSRALFDSFAAWSQASQNRIMFSIVQNPKMADITFSWTGNPYDVRPSAGDVEQGICRIKTLKFARENYTRLDRADVRILTVDRESGKPLSDDDMKKTCLHELGHALGLHGHSTNNHDIMFFSVSPTVWPVLSKRDKATLLRIYEPYPPLMAAY